jgi:hypothetical protein
LTFVAIVELRVEVAANEADKDGGSGGREAFRFELTCAELEAVTEERRAGRHRTSAINLLRAFTAHWPPFGDKVFIFLVSIFLCVFSAGYFVRLYI